MLRPLADRIVVEPLDEPLSTILQVIQLGREGRHSRGRIIAVGPKVKFEGGYLDRGPDDSKVGDIIHFTDAFKFPLIIDHGQKLHILQEADIAAIEEPGMFHMECVAATTASLSRPAQLLRIQCY